MSSKQTMIGSGHSAVVLFYSIFTNWMQMSYIMWKSVNQWNKKKKNKKKQEQKQKKQKEKRKKQTKKTKKKQQQ